MDDYRLARTLDLHRTRYRNGCWKFDKKWKKTSFFLLVKRTYTSYGKDWLESFVVFEWHNGDSFVDQLQIVGTLILCRCNHLPFD